MDVKLWKFYTPYLYWDYNASIKNKGDGKSYLRWKDDRKTIHEVMIPPGVVPITKKWVKTLGEGSETGYIMHGDNFVFADKNTFTIQGAFTNEEIVMAQATAHGAAKGLYDSIATKDKYKNLMWIIAIILAFLVFGAILWLLMGNLGSVFGGLMG